MAENSIYYRQVIQRYTMHDPVKGLDKSFLRALTRAFEEPFCADDFSRFPVNLVVEYVQRTHVYYLQAKLPSIEQTIHLLGGLYSKEHPVLVALHAFLLKYSADLSAHINEEETNLIPYINFLSTGNIPPSSISQYVLSQKRSSIDDFLAGHEDTEDELKEIRDTVRLYEPPEGNASLYRVLLQQLEYFEQDLRVHALIEDHVLLPKARSLEDLFWKKLKELSRLN